MTVTVADTRAECVFCPALSRPLPDERPRPSVANLIGRFEKQKTAASTAPPAFPRTSSVISHRTGDSAQEELKEKREWPPKPAVAAPTLLSTAESESSSSAAQPSLSPLSDKRESATTQEAVPEPATEVHSPINTATSDQIPSMPPTAHPTHPKTATPRSSTVKPVMSKPGAGASVSTPSKPVHRANETPSKQHLAGRSSTPRTPAVSKPSPANSTISRVKSPLSRPRTPSSTPRPKTPSSGLYAPTAASLARSRVSPLLPPPSDKPKRRPTTDLSKPTAASASKVRAPVIAPARGGKAAPVVTATVRTPVKPASTKPTTSPKLGTATRSKVSPAKKDATRVAKSAEIAQESDAKLSEVALAREEHDVDDRVDADGGHAQGVEESQDSHLSHHEIEPHVDEEVEDNHEDGHGPHDSEAVVENYDEDFPEDAHHSVQDGSTVEELSGGALTDDVNNSQNHDDAVDIIESTPSDNTIIPPIPQESHPTLHDDNILPVAHDHKVGNGKEHPVGTELEDIVNLLESVPNVERPTLEPTSVSDAEEIPDEY